MKTPLARGKGVEPPRCISEMLNLMVATYTDELSPAPNGRSQTPSTEYLTEKRRMILKGQCDPFGPLIALGEDALTMHAKLSTVQAPFLQAVAHFEVFARGQAKRAARPVYLLTERETLDNQALDRAQHRNLRDENNVGVLQEIERLAVAQSSSSLALAAAARERIAELVTPAPLPVVVRWTRRTAVHA